MAVEEEELVDYDEATEEVPTNGVAKVEAADKKGSYVGIHSTGFRCVASTTC